MSEIKAEGGSLERPSDAGKGPKGVVARWLMELQLSDKSEEAWRKTAQDVIDRERDEKKRGGTKIRYNILASNVATMEPALYAQSPRPDIRPRFSETDPLKEKLSRDVATLLERAVSFHLDAYDFDGAMEGAVHDMLVPGRAVDRIRYKPVMTKVTPERVPVMPGEEGAYLRQDNQKPVDKYETDEQGAYYIQDDPYDKKVYEETCIEHVQWDDFRRGPGKTWAQVPWIGFKHKFVKDECAEKFGKKIAEQISYDDSPEGLSKDENLDQGVFKRCVVWEIWDKPSRKVIWIAPSYADEPAKTEEDPLELEQFFPIPKPLYARPDPSSLVPKDDFRYYKDLADELDTITRRIAIITAGLKFRGMYDSAIQGLGDLMKGEDNDFLPAVNATAITQGGGLEKALFFLPIDMAATVLAQLYNQRANVKEDIFELSGVADIMRGSTNANETLGAQRIKAQWGTQRLQKRQRAVQRYARDLIRIMAEIIAEKYDPMTLKMMTGIEVTDEMLQVMRLDGPRAFRIDIETDSTIAADTEAEQANLAELTQGLGGLIQAFGPIVQSGAMPIEAAKAIIMSLTRKFKLGREVEDALDQMAKQPTQQQADPAQQAAQMEQQKHDAEMQAVQAETQARQIKAQADAQAVQLKAQADAAKHQADMERLRLDSERQQAEHVVAMEELALKQKTARAKAEQAQQGVKKDAA